MWMRTDESEPDSSCMFRIARDLGVCIPHAFGMTQVLCLFVMRQAPSGNLEQFDDEDLSRGARWDGDPTKFAAALRNHGFVVEVDDHEEIVDWQRRMGSIAEAARRALYPRGVENDETVELDEIGEGVVEALLEAFPAFEKPRRFTARCLEDFPTVPLRGEIRDAAEWIKRQPISRKKRDIGRFLRNWFKRQRDGWKTKPQNAKETGDLLSVASRDHARMGGA